MYVKHSLRVLNPGLCPPHPTNTYTCGVTIAPRCTVVEKIVTYSKFFKHIGVWSCELLHSIVVALFQAFHLDGQGLFPNILFFNSLLCNILGFCEWVYGDGHSLLNVLDDAYAAVFYLGLILVYQSRSSFPFHAICTSL